MSTHSKLITVGKIIGAFGVRGWVGLISYTAPTENLFSLQPLWFVNNSIRPLPEKEVHITAFQAHKHDWIAKFAECDDRDVAASWRGAELKVSREQLPKLAENEYYWVDLEGLQVINLENQELGHIDHIFSTGANDIISVKQDKKERYIPYLRPDVVKEVDLSKGVMIVDWDADF